MIDPTIAAVLAAIIAAAGTYIVNARRFSGKIQTSTAEALWKEAGDIRNWSRDRIAELNGVVERLEGRVSELEHSNAALIVENHDLKTEMVKLRGEPT